MNEINVAYVESICRDCAWLRPRGSTPLPLTITQAIRLAKRHAAIHVGHRVRVRLVTAIQFQKEGAKLKEVKGD